MCYRFMYSETGIVMKIVENYHDSIGIIHLADEFGSVNTVLMQFKQK